MATPREIIDRVDAHKPNQYSLEDKLRWINELEYSIYHDIISTHRFRKCEEPIAFRPIENIDQMLIVPFPYDEVYDSYIKMRIDDENQETARYNNSVVMYNAHLDNFAKFWNKHHMPKNKSRFRIWG